MNSIKIQNDVEFRALSRLSTSRSISKQPSAPLHPIKGHKVYSHQDNLKKYLKNIKKIYLKMNIVIFLLATVQAFSGLAWRSQQSALQNNRQLYGLLARVKLNHMNSLRQKRAAQEVESLKEFRRGRFLNRN